MLSQVPAMRQRIDEDVATMKSWMLPPAMAHHLMVEAVRGNIVPASRLPKVLNAWERPAHLEFQPRTAWSLFNAFTEVQKDSGRGLRWKEASDSVSSFSQKYS